MGTSQRGLIIFIGLVIFATLFCYYIPFVWFGNTGSVVALPVIEVPGEVLVKGGFFGMNLTNTLVGTFLADILVLMFVALAWWASNGWKNEIPNRFQAWSETIVDAIYGFVKQMAGTEPRVRNILFPLVASIFLFLLAANWLELLPGVDSIGIMHCAHGKQSGYMRVGDRLYNDRALYPGTTATEEQEHYCHEVLVGHIVVDTENYDSEQVAVIDAVSLVMNTDVESLSAERVAELEARLESDYGYELAVEAVHDGDITEEEFEELRHAYEDATGFHEVVYYPTADELAGGVQPYSFVVTPFIRAAATDLNLTIGLALVSFVAIQYFGLAALGPGYLQKFVNLRALGEINKKPMGLIDFAVGLFEIISEFAKVISLAFRLFGNIFAGQLLLFIMAFLVAMVLPVIFFGLELIVGFIQALVFAVLTLVFSAQAMVSHHHDDHDEHH